MHPNTRDTICCHKKKREKKLKSTKIKHEEYFEVKKQQQRKFNVMNKRKCKLDKEISFMLGFS